MSKVIYGVDGIRQRNYRVWINFEDMTSGAGELDFITAVDKMANAFVEISDTPPRYPDAKTELDNLKDVMYHIGEMRADSIDLAVEDGDSVEGNEVGKIVMGKNGKFSSELINSTPDILTWLGQRDTKECIIMLEEMDSTRLKNYDGAMLETHEIIFIGNVPAMAAGITDNVGGAFNYVEKITGKNIAISTINVEKTVPSAGAFRKIFDFRYEEPLIAPRIDTLGCTTGNNIIIEMELYTNDGDCFLMEFSEDSDFQNIYHRHQTADITDVAHSFDSEKVGWIWVRVSVLKNGIQKTVYAIDSVEV
jgi:hypothetical protein